MTLMELGSLGEFLSAIGVIVSLVYVGIQVRQSNKLALAASQRETHQASQYTNHMKVEHASVFRRGLNDFNGLTKDEQTVFSLIVSTDMNFLDQQLKMRETGLATDEDVATWGTWCLSLVASNGGRQWWDMVGPVLYSASGSYINERLADDANPPVPVTAAVSFLGPDDT